MDIDSFYNDGDMSFGMDGRIAFSNEAQFLRADGGGRAAEVQKWYAISKDCVEVENTIARAKGDLKNNIDKLADPKAKRGQKRVLSDYNELIKKRIVELEDAYRKLGCAANKKKEEESAFLDTLQTLANPKTENSQTAKPKSNTMKYVFYGIGGLILAGFTIFVMKKANK
jgi:hypothetical protein